VHLSLDVGWLSAFLLAMTRSTAWLFIAPPFNSTAVPLKVRLGLAMALGLFIAPHFQEGPALLDSWAFIGSAVYQAFIGLAMGFGVLLLISAVTAAGAFIDLAAGFSASNVYDPFSHAGSTPIARLYQVVATAILFASNGHTLILRGFLATFSVAPTDGGTTLGTIAEVLTHNFGTFFAAALQMAVPLLAALFLAEVAIGMLARATPQMNLLFLSFTVKMGATIVLVAMAIRVLPAVLYPLVQQSADTMRAFAG
jgi:flagellar biosynthesis protein FliR